MQSYDHAKWFDTEFLMMTGLCQDMNRTFTAAGWSRFADITEPGSHMMREGPGTQFACAIRDMRGSSSCHA